MKILTNKEYKKLVSDLNKAIKLLKEGTEIVKNLQAENSQLKKDLKDLQNFCINYAADNSKFNNAFNLEFPNTKERGVGEADTPNNLSDKSFY